MLISLHNDIFANKNNSEIPLPQLLDWAEAVWMILADGELVGYTAVWQVPGVAGLLEMNGGIHTEHRRQGLGTALLQHVIAECKQLPFHTLSYPVADLDTAVAKFLHHHNFWVEHEEWTMTLSDLSTVPELEKPLCQLQTFPRAKAISQFINLYDDSFANTPWNQPFTQTEVANMLQNAADICFLMENKKAVGVVWLHFSNEHVYHANIEPIGIIQEAQGKGYGRILLTSILHQLAQQHVQTVSLGVWANNHKAINLYQSVGFQQTDTVTYLAKEIVD